MAGNIAYVMEEKLPAANSALGADARKRTLRLNRNTSENPSNLEV